jgi:ribonuclease HI
MNFIIYTDGASRGNPGHASCGIVIQSPDGVIWVQDGKYLGIATNNVAEYNAVLWALERLVADFAKHLPTKVEFRLDSQLLANQLSGNFKVKNPNLQILHAAVKGLESQVGQVTYTYTPRANNFLADKMANIALDTRSS